MKKCSVCKKEKECRTYEYFVLSGNSAYDYVSSTRTTSYNLNNKKLDHINLCENCIEKKTKKTLFYLVVTSVLALILIAIFTVYSVIPAPKEDIGYAVLVYFFLLLYPVSFYIYNSRWNIPKVREKRILKYSKEIANSKFPGQHTRVWMKGEKPPF